MATRSAARLFRVVLVSDSSLRLMEKSGDDAALWRLDYTGGPLRVVNVRDLVQEQQGVPRHLGLEYTVELESSDLDQAAEDARRSAEAVALMLATTTHAPVSRVVLQLAYEITPGIEEREFRQWYWDPPIPISKRSADPKAFGELRERFDALASEPEAERLVWRTISSLSWFRQGLEETDPLFRFQKLWVAAEALNPLLDEHYRIPEDQRSGFQGLRALAEELGLGSNWVSRALGLRRSLFHGLRAIPDDLRRTADSLMADLEAVCLAGWKVLLDIEVSFPDESVIWHPLYLRVGAVLIERDETRWGIGSQPFLEFRRLNIEKVEAPDPRDVTFKMSPTYTKRNIDEIRLTSHGMWGPTGHQALTWEGETQIEVERGVDSNPNPTDG